jgi:hypothetical protein
MATAANSTRSLSPEKLAAAEQRQGVGAKVTLEPEGIRFRGISWLKPNSQQKYQMENTANRLPRRLPTDTLFMFSGSNLAQWWDEYVQGAESNPLTPIPPANLSTGLQGTLGVDLEQDLLPWMSGEFSLALVPASQDILTSPENRQSPLLGAGVVLMVQANDRARAEAAFQKLDQVMASRYQFVVEQTKMGSQPVTSWTSPLGGVNATHGWLDGNVAFLTLGAPIASAIVPQPPTTLPQTPLFQEAVPTKPNPNSSQFFLDVERTINKETLNLPQLPLEQKMWAKAIRAIGFSAATNDERSNRFDLFFHLKTGRTPSDSPDTKPSVSPSSSPSSSRTTPSPSP